MTPALFDTHCHYLSRTDFAALQGRLRTARAAGLVQALVCPADFAELSGLPASARKAGLTYALGLHPFDAVRFFLEPEAMLAALAELLNASRADPLLTALGEIGLDFSEKELRRQSETAGLSTDRMRSIQTELFEAQLRLAVSFGLPVTVHAREAPGAVLNVLSRHPGIVGVVHAFNGSYEVARRFLDSGFKLGFGGALTYEGSRKIRSVFSRLPPQAWVLETDAPWMPTAQRRLSGKTAAEPADLVEVLRHAALLRGLSLEDAARQARVNTAELFPGLVETAFAAPPASQD